MNFRCAVRCGGGVGDDGAAIVSAALA